jgi:hypothetical protein
VIAISYRREDSVTVAGRLYDRLESAFGKENVFMDFDSIPAGVNFRDYIIAAIERSQLVIALIGPKWVGEKVDSRRIDEVDDFVRLEITSALARGISVIPVLVNNAEMPRPDQLPSDLRELAFLNALPLDGGRDFQIHAERLVGVIRTVHPPRHGLRARRRKAMKIIGALAAVFVLAASIFTVVVRPWTKAGETKKPAAPTPVVSPNMATPQASASPVALPEFLGAWSSVSSGEITGGAGTMTVRDDLVIQRDAIDEMIASEWTANETVVFRITLHIRYGELWVSGNELNARCLAADVSDVFDPKEFGKLTKMREQTANAAKAGVNLIYKFALNGSELQRGQLVFSKGTGKDRKKVPVDPATQASPSARSSSSPSPSAQPSQKQKFAGKWSGPGVTSNGPRTEGTIGFEIEGDDHTVRLGNGRRIVGTRTSDTVLSWSYAQHAENSGSYIGHATLRLIGQDKASYREETTGTEGLLKGKAGPIFTATLTRKTK